MSGVINIFKVWLTFMWSLHIFSVDHFIGFLFFWIASLSESTRDGGEKYNFHNEIGVIAHIFSNYSLFNEFGDFVLSFLTACIFEDFINTLCAAKNSLFKFVYIIFVFITCTSSKTISLSLTSTSMKNCLNASLFFWLHLKLYLDYYQNL